MMIIQDIENQSRTSPTYGIFNRGKIQGIMKANQIALGKLNGFIAEITAKYAKKDDAGRAAIVIVDNQQQLDFNSEEDKKAFTEQYHAFLQGSIQLHT